MRTLLALMMMSATAYAGDHELAIGGTSRALHSPSANAVTHDSLVGGALGYAHHLPIELAPGLQIWVEGRFGWGGVEGTMFQTLSTELDTLAFTAGGRARYPVFQQVPGLRHAPILRHLTAIARLDVGTARAAFAIRDEAGHTASDAGWGGTSAAALGLELVGPPRSRFSVGLRAELGYTAATAIPLVATPEDGDMATLELATTAAGLGSLDLSGRMFVLSAVGQF
jgi:hypothetical protein